MLKYNNIVYNVLGFILLISTPGSASESKLSKDDLQSFQFHSDPVQDNISPNIGNRDLQNTLRTDRDESKEEMNVQISHQNINDYCLIKVTTAEGLHHALSSLNSPTTIELAEGTYIGEFVVLSSNTIIRGKGDSTIIQLDHSGTNFNHEIVLNILGDNCTVQNLKVITDYYYTTGIQINGTGTNIIEVELDGFTSALATQTNGNRFTNVQVKNARWGFYIDANGNTIQDIFIENISDWAIKLQGDGNSIKNLRSYGHNFGLISVKGNYNKIQNIDAKKSESGGIDIFGSGNSVDHFASNKFCLYLAPVCRKAMISNVFCPMVVIQGKSHYVFNVDAGERLEVFGSGHRIENCNATLLLSGSTNVTIVESYFKEVE